MRSFFLPLFLVSANIELNIRSINKINVTVLFPGVIYIFMFFNAKEEKTRYKYLLYYTFCLIENTAIITIWFVYTILFGLIR